MKTKEKLERAGWLFLLEFGTTTEVYGRGTLRVLYNRETDEIYGFYRTDSKVMLTTPDAYQLELFFEK